MTAFKKQACSKGFSCMLRRLQQSVALTLSFAGPMSLQSSGIHVWSRSQPGLAVQVTMRQRDPPYSQSSGTRAAADGQPSCILARYCSECPRDNAMPPRESAACPSFDGPWHPLVYFSYCPGEDPGGGGGGGGGGCGQAILLLMMALAHARKAAIASISMPSMSVFQLSPWHQQQHQGACRIWGKDGAHFFLNTASYKMSNSTPIMQTASLQLHTAHWQGCHMLEYYKISDMRNPQLSRHEGEPGLRAPSTGKASLSGARPTFPVGLNRVLP